MRLIAKKHHLDPRSWSWATNAEELLQELDGWTPVVTSIVGQGALERGDIQALYTIFATQRMWAPDLVIQWLPSPEAPHQSLVIYLSGLADAKQLADNLNGHEDAYLALQDIGVETQLVRSWRDLMANYLTGNVVIVRAGVPTAISVNLSDPPHRSVSQPTLERSVRGPQEAFVEPLDIKLSQIRNVLPSPDLRVESLTVGSRIPTACALVYLSQVAAPKVVSTAHARLAHLDIDSATNATRLGSLIRDAPWSLFPTIRYTERVDLAALSIEQGKVVIMINGDPSIIIVPATLADFYRTSYDYSTVWYDASFVRIIRWMAWGFSVFLPSLYIALTEVNPDLISPTLFDLIAGSHTGLPFTPLVEVVVMILVIEILREAALRLPQGLGSTIGTVGAIVVGTAVVKAGFVSPQIIVLMTLTALSLFSVPSYDLLASWRLISWVMLFVSFILGVYGLVITTLCLSMILIDLQSFGTPYLVPLTPLRSKDLGNLLWRIPWSSLKRRQTDSQAVDLRWKGDR